MQCCLCVGVGCVVVSVCGCVLCVCVGGGVLLVVKLFGGVFSPPIRCGSMGLCFVVYLLVYLFTLNWGGLVKKKKLPMKYFR